MVASCDFKTASPPMLTASASPVVRPTPGSSPASDLPASSGTATPTSTPDRGRPAEPSAPPDPRRLESVIGTVYDERGVVVDEAVITVRSLDVSVPYRTTVTMKKGAYAVPDVPQGANIELLATRPGWTTRRRVGSFQQQVTHVGPDVIDFGAPLDAGPDAPDPTGAATTSPIGPKSWPSIPSPAQST